MLHARTPYESDDLASLALDAAIALDNVLLGRPSGDLSTLRQLATAIEESLPSGSAIDPTTAFAVRHALINTPGVPVVTTAGELVENTNKLAAQLAEFHAPGDVPSEEEIKRLRAFCLGLSRSLNGLRRGANRHTDRSYRE